MKVIYKTGVWSGLMCNMTDSVTQVPCVDMKRLFRIHAIVDGHLSPKQSEKYVKNRVIKCDILIVENSYLMLNVSYINVIHPTNQGIKHSSFRESMTEQFQLRKIIFGKCLCSHLLTLVYLFSILMYLLFRETFMFNH